MSLCVGVPLLLVAALLATVMLLALLHDTVSFLGECYLSYWSKLVFLLHAYVYRPQRSPGLVSPLCGQGIVLVSLNCVAVLCLCFLNCSLSNSAILQSHVYRMMILLNLLTIFVPRDDGSLL